MDKTGSPSLILRAITWMCSVTAVAPGLLADFSNSADPSIACPMSAGLAITTELSRPVCPKASMVASSANCALIGKAGGCKMSCRVHSIEGPVCKQSSMQWVSMWRFLGR